MRKLYAHYVCLFCQLPQELSFATEAEGQIDDPFPNDKPCLRDNCKGKAKRRYV